MWPYRLAEENAEENWALGRFAEEMLRKIPACLSSSSGDSVSPQESQYARRYGVLDLLRKC